MNEEEPTDSNENMKSTPSKLKESTGRLMCLLDAIEAKTRTKTFIEDLEENASSLNLTISTEDMEKVISSNNSEDEYDDCTIYKKLTRICQCLNRAEFTDMLMEFNSETQYHTSQFGEILKNIRILKKFLYIGNEYTSNALHFLIEGLTTSTPPQREQIVKACAYADICNIFDDYSFVTKCIVFEYDQKSQQTIPILAARFLNKLTMTQEGKNYLTLTSKLAHEIIEFVKKESQDLHEPLRDTLYDIVDVLKPGPQLSNFYFKPVDTSLCGKTVNNLVQFHEFMSLEEVKVCLGTIKTLSESPSQKHNLIKHLPDLITAFKSLLVKYNNSEINILVTNILNNVVTRSMIDNSEQTEKSVDFDLKSILKNMDNNNCLKNYLSSNEVTKKPMSTGLHTYLNRSTSPLTIPEKKEKKGKVDFSIPQKFNPMSTKRTNNAEWITSGRRPTGKNKTIILVPKENYRLSIN